MAEVGQFTADERSLLYRIARTLLHERNYGSFWPNCSISRFRLWVQIADALLCGKEHSFARALRATSAVRR